MPSVLWRCWVGDRKGIRPVNNWVVRCWHGYLSGARCRLACAQLMPLPLTVSCFSKIQIGFTFLVPAHPGSPGHRAVKRGCVCVCVVLWSLKWWSWGISVNFSLVLRLGVLIRCGHCQFLMFSFILVNVDIRQSMYVQKVVTRVWVLILIMSVTFCIGILTLTLILTLTEISILSNRVTA